MRLNFTVSLPPVPKPRMTQSDKWKKRPSVIRYREFADAVRAGVIDAKRDAGLSDMWSTDGPVQVSVWFRENEVEVQVEEVSWGRDGIAGDIDNLCKSVIEGLHPQQSGKEALVPIALKDDDQVVGLHATIVGREEDG